MPIKTQEDSYGCFACAVHLYTIICGRLTLQSRLVCTRSCEIGRGMCCDAERALVKMCRTADPLCGVCHLKRGWRQGFCDEHDSIKQRRISDKLR